MREAEILAILVLRDMDRGDEGDAIGFDEIDLGAAHATDVVGVAVVIGTDRWVGLLRHRDEVHGDVAAAAGAAQVQLEAQSLASQAEGASQVIDAGVIVHTKAGAAAVTPSMRGIISENIRPAVEANIYTGLLGRGAALLEAA
jgi:hypothetical protein